MDFDKSVHSSIAAFVENREGKGRETAVKGNSLDSLADTIENIVLNSVCSQSKISVLKGRKAHVPGYFRPAKNWDIVIKKNDDIIAVIELKSLTCSHGNNFNNRVEECLGNAIDIITYYRNKEKECPFIGYLLVINENDQTIKKRKFQVVGGSLDKFLNTGYLERAHILCNHLNTSQIYHSAELITYSITENKIKVNSDRFKVFIDKLLLQLNLNC